MMSVRSRSTQRPWRCRIRCPPPPVQAWQQWWWALLIMLPSLTVSIRMLGAVLGVMACSGGLLAAFVAQPRIVNVPGGDAARRDLRVVLVSGLLPYAS